MDDDDRDWITQAACVGMDPDIWFPEPGGDNGRQAKLICALCPVREACLTYAQTEHMHFGIWGGRSFGRASQRRRQVAKSSELSKIGLASARALEQRRQAAANSTSTATSVATGSDRV